MPEETAQAAAPPAARVDEPAGETGKAADPNKPDDTAESDDPTGRMDDALAAAMARYQQSRPPSPQLDLTPESMAGAMREGGQAARDLAARQARLRDEALANLGSQMAGMIRDALQPPLPASEGRAEQAGACTPLPPNCDQAGRRVTQMLSALPRITGIRDSAAATYCALLIGQQANTVCEREYRTEGRTGCADIVRRQIDANNQAIAQSRRVLDSTTSSTVQARCRLS